MATIVQCDCGAEYKRTETKFLVPHTGHATCKVCGATLESWLESTHLARQSQPVRPDVNAIRNAQMPEAAAPRICQLNTAYAVRCRQLHRAARPPCARESS